MEGEGRAKRSSPRTSPSHCPGPWSSRNISAVWGVRGKEVYEEPGHIKQCGTPQTTPSIAPHKPQLLHTTQSTTPSACRIKSSPSIQVPLQLAHSFSFQSRLLWSPPHSQPDGVAVLDTHVTVAPALPSSPVPPPPKRRRRRKKSYYALSGEEFGGCKTQFNFNLSFYVMSVSVLFHQTPWKMRSVF